ncbi:MAG TPA: response regulator [Tepidisphaeraceae bacterium]|jgi:CheY-like chemotaxis protein|nr:response regulator [Tepidisphaeraceae bacterium]
MIFCEPPSMVPSPMNNNPAVSAKPSESPVVAANILVVDDTASAREPLARLLRLSGYATTCAGDGLEALTVMERRTPDLVLLDLMMPNVDGLSFLRQIRNDPRFARVPVILITAADASEQLAEARGVGVQGCMIKAAFTVPELLERIARTLHPTN